MNSRVRMLREAIEFYRFTGDAVFNARTGKIISGTYSECREIFDGSVDSDQWFWLTYMYFPVFNDDGEFVGYEPFMRR